MRTKMSKRVKCLKRNGSRELGISIEDLQDIIIHFFECSSKQKVVNYIHLDPYPLQTLY